METAMNVFLIVWAISSIICMISSIVDWVKQSTLTVGDILFGLVVALFPFTAILYAIDIIYSDFWGFACKKLHWIMDIRVK